MSRPLPRTSRRAALGLGLGGAVGVAGALVGCSTGDPGTAPGDSQTAPRSPATAAAGDVGTGEPSPVEQDPDTALVALAVAQISAAHALVRANRRAHPSIAASLRDLERLHVRHAAELGGLTTVAPPVTPQRRPRQVGPLVAAAERRLQRQLVDHTVAAESGALALLLASMAAGLAQESALR